MQRPVRTTVLFAAARGLFRTEKRPGRRNCHEQKTFPPSAGVGAGDVPYADGFDTTAKFNTGMNGDTLCIAFNGIQKRDTGYFQPAGDTITLTAAATSDSERLKTFKAALWKQGEGTAVYVEGATLVFTADGELYTGSFSGLDPDAKYKVTISYDSGYYTISGGMSIAGLVEADAAKNE